jgi:hypothetical protein
LLAGGAGLLAGAYAANAAVTWLRYGRAPAATGSRLDPLLDTFIPQYDAVEHHQIDVDAPAGVTFGAACDMALDDSPVVRAIFRAREVLMRSAPDGRPLPHGLLAQTQALGWRELARVPDREVVMGAVTKPWESNPTFRGIPPEQFRAFDEPGYVKIVWTLRAEPRSGGSTFHTETRVLATDRDARRRFRVYWAFLSPGIWLIRWIGLRPMKAEAERRAASREDRLIA